MSRAAGRRIRRAALAAAGLAALAAVAGAAIPPGSITVLDAFADPFGAGHFGALLRADPWAPAGDSATPLSSSALLYQASDLAFRADGSLVVVDRDADPSGLGPDPNGEPGPGAVLVAAATDQSFSVLADGQDYPAGLPPPSRTAFVDPRGVAVAADGITALVADTDADPSNFGPDSSGFAGHGALFSVDAAGTVRLVSDGSLSDDGPPPRAAPSWFEDPGAACVASDGSAYVLDIFGDPLATGGRGAVFRVDLATGRIRLVAVSSAFVGPGGLAELSPGRLVVSDQLADLRGDGSRGALFAIDLAEPDPRLAVSLLVTDSMFRGPAGMGPAADGSLFVADPFADPLRLSRIGAIFRLRPDGTLSIASAAAQYLAPVSVKVAPSLAAAPVLSTVVPDRAEAGTSLTVTLNGSGLASPAELRLGAGIEVTALRVLAGDVAEADLVLDAGASAGSREAAFVNPDLQVARLPGAFEVLPRLGPEPTSVTPSAGIQGTSVDVVVRGDRFADGAAIEAGPDIVATATTWRSPTEIATTLQVGLAAAAGPRDLTVRNPDGLAGTLASGFEVLEPASPTPSAVTPAILSPGQAADLVVDGAGFAPGMTLDLGAGIVPGPVSVESPFLARVRAFARADAGPGPRDAVATNPDLRTGTLSPALSVADAPAVRRVAVLVADDGPEANATGFADPGEVAGLDVIAWSEGPRPLVNPVLRVSVVAGPAAMTRASVSLGAAGPGLLRRPAAPFPELRIAPEARCGDAIALRVEILEGSVVLLDSIHQLPVGREAGFVRKPSLDGDSSGARGGQSVALGDVDGDGVPDLVSGAPRSAPGGLLAAGSVRAVSGATDDPLWTRDGAEIDGLLGSALAMLGDLDGDGASEIAAGAPGEAAGAGRVHVLDGRTGAVLRSATGAPADGLGASLAFLGDRELDGRPDLAAGAPLAGSGAGRVLVLSLPGLGFEEALDGAPGDALGTALAAAGDLDGDGRADAAAGAPGAGAGRVALWRADGSLTFLDGASAGEGFGAALAGGFDADLDGLPDLLAGAPRASVAGLAAAGRVEWISGIDLSRRILPGSEEGSELGAALASPGDLDGDGRADAAIGVPGAAGGDGRVEIRGGDRALLGWEEGPSGGRARFGAALAAARTAGGLPLLAAGAPRENLPGRPLAGRAVMLQPEPACEAVVPCDPDALEPNAPGNPATIGYGSVPGLGICRGDIDVFRIDLPAGSRATALIRFAHADGDLDAILLDAGGAVAEQSLSSDDDETLGPFGPGGTWEIRVAGFDGATNGYELRVLDPDTCVPALEVQGLRVRKEAGLARLTWSPSVDPCHAPAPGPSYRVWLAASPAGPRGGRFPADTGFADATLADGDGDLSDASHLSDAPGPAFWLVSDVSRSGDDGPSGWGPTR